MTVLQDIEESAAVPEGKEIVSFEEPTIWGLSVVELHDRFWASRGVQVVRQGEPSAIVDDAELFLLTDPRTLVTLRLREVVEKMVWMKPELLMVRLRNQREAQYRERVICDDRGAFLRYKREYGGWDSRLARLMFTRDPEIARTWQNAQDVRTSRRRFRKQIRPQDRASVPLPGRAYDRSIPEEAAHFVRDLIGLWKRPDTTISGIRQVKTDVWALRDTAVDDAVEFIGPVWVGAGRKVNAGTGVFGPTALWDLPEARPAHEELEWQEIEPRDVLANLKLPPTSTFYEKSKRLFDLVGASLGLLAVSWVFPIVMVATWLEDGRPFFYAQRRETKGGKEFGCLKFRSMRRNADEIKKKLMEANQADGPQFFMKDDPRLTRTGKFLRKYNIDEFPQLWNVLKGEMSLVGPRPSPRAENQFCPPWREARLSVPPGITGLWQVKRTRRRGLDFQEWIKFDLAYVKKAGWRMDLSILMETIRVVILGQRS